MSTAPCRHHSIAQLLTEREEKRLRKLKQAETRHSTLGYELLVDYITAKHFPYFLDVRNFHITTDHKAVIYAFCGNYSSHRGREPCQLALISEFTRDLRCIRGVDDDGADAFSRVEAVFSSPTVSTDTLTAAQSGGNELEEHMTSTTSLTLTLTLTIPSFAKRSVA